jgi:secondary thiamine-phosphate synthase enzyme
VQTGLVNVFLRHTSASLIIFENADLSARRDLEKFFERLVPEGEEYFSHTTEGSDDMPSHIRMALTRTSESIPVATGKLWLGAWQGLFLYEHRNVGSRSLGVMPYAVDLEAASRLWSLSESLLGPEQREPSSRRPGAFWKRPVSSPTVRQLYAILGIASYARIAGEPVTA